ncbi:hypothetical protein V8E53_006913 [Lactarius tabidus]
MSLSTTHPLPFLPTEVVSKIMAELEIQELVACQATSRRLHTIIDGSLLLQYHICLAASGMRDGPLSNATTAERMAALRDYTDAWRDLSWSAYDKIDIPSHMMPQFSDGVVVYLSEDRRALTVLQLPSKLRRLAAHRWTLTFDYVVARFVIDAAQDLLALVPMCATPSPAQWCEPRILLRALSTGEPHPLAAPSATTPATIELAESKLQPSMEGDTTSIHGSYLGTVVQGGPTDELTIWNWKTGELEWGMPLDKGIGQWCFLDETHILFPKNLFVGNPTLRARQRRLHVRSFRRTESEAERIFVLPDPRYPLGSSMGARLLSRPTPDPSASQNAFTSGELFHPSAEDHLLTIELWAYYASGWEVTDVHIPTRVLLSPQSTNVVPWDAWCSDITQSPPLEHPRDMAPLGPLSHGMRRLCWDCGTNSRSRSRAQAATVCSASATTAEAEAAHQKAVSVWDLHRGRTEQALSALHDIHGSEGDGHCHGPAAIQFASCPCGGDELGPQSTEVPLAPKESKERPYIHSEVPLPQEIQEADPIGIKFAMCGDALVVLELGDHETNTLHILTF